MFDNISKLSILIQELRDQGLHSSELSRVNQFISKLAIATENLKVILHYRTPVSLRAYSKIFIYSFPILFGPFFEEVSEDYTRGLEYFMPVMFSFILVSLDNIQDQLENPFDQVGEDDVKFDVERFHDMVE